MKIHSHNNKKRRRRKKIREIICFWILYLQYCSSQFNLWKCRFSSAGPVAKWKYEYDSTYIHRQTLHSYMGQGKRNEGQIQGTKYDHINYKYHIDINPLHAKSNPICRLLALLGAHPILHVSRVRVKTKIHTKRQWRNYSVNNNNNNDNNNKKKQRTPFWLT
jgi:hypothetical protein